MADFQCEKCKKVCTLEQTKQLYKSNEEQFLSDGKTESEKLILTQKLDILQKLILYEEKFHFVQPQQKNENEELKSSSEAISTQPDSVSARPVLSEKPVSNQLNSVVATTQKKQESDKGSQIKVSKNEVTKNSLQAAPQLEKVKIADPLPKLEQKKNSPPEKYSVVVESVLQTINYDQNLREKVVEKILLKLQRIEQQLELYGTFRKKYQNENKSKQSVEVGIIQIKQNINIGLFCYWLQTLGADLSNLKVSHPSAEKIGKVLQVNLFSNQKGGHQCSITGFEELNLNASDAKQLAVKLKGNYCSNANSINKKQRLIVKTFVIKDNFFAGLVSELEQFKIKPNQIIFTIDLLCTLSNKDLKQFLISNLQPNLLKKNQNADPQNIKNDQYSMRLQAEPFIPEQNQKTIRVQTNDFFITTIFGIRKSKKQITVLKETFSLKNCIYYPSELALEIGKVNRTTIDKVLEHFQIDSRSVEFLGQGQSVFQTDLIQYQEVKKRYSGPQVFCNFLCQPQVWIFNIEQFGLTLEYAIDVIAMKGLLTNYVAKIERLYYLRFICIRGSVTSHDIEKMLDTLGIIRDYRQFNGHKDFTYSVRVPKTVQVITTRGLKNFEEDDSNYESNEDEQKWSQWERVRVNGTK